MYKNEHMDISSADAPQTPTWWENNPNPQQKGKMAHMIYRYPWNIPMHREPTTECGGPNEGKAPPYRGGVREVS